MESEMDVVTTIDLQTADEFLDALRPRSDHFKNLRDGGFPKPTERYVFRGHEDDRFELLPSALRLKGKVKIKASKGWGYLEWNESENRENFVDAQSGIATPFSGASYRGKRTPETFVSRRSQRSDHLRRI